jgi:hypothetical protein
LEGIAQDALIMNIDDLRGAKSIIFYFHQPLGEIKRTQA